MGTTLQPINKLINSKNKLCYFHQRKIYQQFIFDNLYQVLIDKYWLFYYINKTISLGYK